MIGSSEEVFRLKKMRLREAFSLSFRHTTIFARKAWWAVLLPVLPDLVFSTAKIHGVLSDKDYRWLTMPLSIVSAVVAVLATYWIVRFFVLGQTVGRAFSVDRRSLSTFIPYVAVFSPFWFCVNWLFQRSLESGSIGSILIIGLLTLCVESLFAPWSVAAPSGSTSIGPIVSLKHAWKHLPWSGFLLLAVGIPFEFALKIFDGFGETGTAGVWLQTFALIFSEIVEALSLVAHCAALLAIAYHIGVRTSDSAPIREIFA